MGIEPTSEAWEASILPLYDARSLFLIVLRNRPPVQWYETRSRVLRFSFPIFFLNPSTLIEWA